MGCKWKVFILLGIFLWPHTSWGAFDIEPRLLVREEFTDNLFLDDSRKESDFITTLAPGIMLAYEARLLQLNLDYSLHFLKYIDHPEKDETSPSDTQRINFKGVIFPDHDFSLTVLDSYDRATIDDRRQTSVENPFVNKTNVNSLQINPEYRWRRSATFEPILGYRYARQDYDAPEGDDNKSHDFYLDLRKILANSRMTVFAGGRQLFFKTQNEEDYRQLDVTGGFDYRISSALSLHASGGNSWIDFEDQDDVTELLWRIGLTYQPGSRWKAELFYVEDNPHTVDDGLSRRKSIQASFNYLGPFPIDLNFFADKQDFLTKDLEDRRIGGNATVTFPLSSRLSMELSGGAIAYKFLPEEENVIQYNVGLAAGYRLKIGSLSAGYRYESRDSDLDVNEFQSNVVYVQLLLMF